MIPQTKTINLTLKLSKIYIAEYLALIGHSNQRKGLKHIVVLILLKLT